MTVHRVIVTRSGGFAGISATADVDDPDEAERLSTAVRAAADRSVGRARDDFVYQFTIIGTTTREQVELAGSQLTDELRPAMRSLFRPKT